MQIFQRNQGDNTANIRRNQGENTANTDSKSIEKQILPYMFNNLCENWKVALKKKKRVQTKEAVTNTSM